MPFLRFVAFMVLIKLYDYKISKKFYKISLKEQFKVSWLNETAWAIFLRHTRAREEVKWRSTLAYLPEYRNFMS